MKNNPLPGKGLYAITDCANLDTDTLLERTERILKAGISMLQYRDKSGDRRKRAYEARALARLCREHGCPFLINDDITLAKNLPGDGVHLGADDGGCRLARQALGADAIIGLSCYNDLALAICAEQEGADYVAFGAFYQTRTKPGATRAAPEIISEAKHSLSIPVIAIGGLTPENCQPLLSRGADMLAVARSLYQSTDPHAVVGDFNRLLHQH